MNTRALLSASLVCLLMTAACQPGAQEAPATAAIKAKVEALGNTVIEGGEQLSEKAETAKENLEAFGNKTTAGVEMVKGGLTAVGDTVLSVTGGEQQPQQQQRP